jgi:glycosyltransferase involved in cell wall biosynthesis
MCKAALTIVSDNYIAAARVLARSFLDHQPGARFFVLLVGEPNSRLRPASEPFELIEFDEIFLPASDAFRYQYTLLELNTAVKPFALRHIFDQEREITKLVYIDPDIVIFRPLTAVWEALDNHEIALIPHMRAPFLDRGHPSEKDILTSGTYNLGFIGLRRGETADRLLAWWMEKLHLDCVVDVSEGLFVDQKWMDLVPGYFPSTALIHEPEYNVAYWNLHEREVVASNESCLVEGRPLAFFHFSGYSPDCPDRLSLHQSRHQMEDLPGVRALCRDYDARLVAEGYTEVSSWPYSFANLPNGIPVSRAVQWVLRHCQRHSIPFPSPAGDPDGFCRFLMRPNGKMPGMCPAPIVAGTVNVRRDVAAHFPQALWQELDEGIMGWMEGYGRVEEGIGELLDRFGSAAKEESTIYRIEEILERRTDVIAAYPNLCTNKNSYRQFCGWLRRFGTEEEGLKAEDLTEAEKYPEGLYRVLLLYFSHSDLPRQFPRIHERKERRRFREWLVEHLSYFESISYEDVVWFDILCTYEPETVLCINATYNAWLRKLTGAELSIFTLFRFEPLLGEGVDAAASLRDWLTSDRGPSPLYQVQVAYDADPMLRRAYPQAFSDPEQLEGLVGRLTEGARRGTDDLPAAWRGRLLSEAASFDPSVGRLNIAGFFDAPTGIGQSARALARAAAEAGYCVHRVTLPTASCTEGAFESKPDKALPFGLFSHGLHPTIVVANADMALGAMGFLSRASVNHQRCIAYWVWETEELPASAAAASAVFDQIWTPSHYSAEAIRKHVDKPVHVVPHALVPEELDAVRASRGEFVLPENAFVFGYFFDQLSVMKRKNPELLVNAFLDAFEDNEDVHLALKVSATHRGGTAYQLLRAQLVKRPRIHLMEGAWSRDRVLALMACLDAYVSPHRSEGFGLTLAEAAVLRKPVVAAPYSGNVDFLRPEEYWPIDYVRVRVGGGAWPYPPTHVWAEPDLDSLKRQLLEVYNVRSLSDRVDQARRAVLRRLDPRVVGRRIRSLIEGCPDETGKAVQ